ncbi:MAG TPA: hypothetical protein VIX89_03160 [Bryobacteraceae bacterium]
MFRRHIDFLAVFFLAIVMAAFSKASSLRLPDREVVRLQNAVNAESCPLSRALARLDNILNR